MKAELEAEGDLTADLDFDLIERYLGPSVWHMRSTDDGFVIKSYMLDAGDN